MVMWLASGVLAAPTMMNGEEHSINRVSLGPGPHPLVRRQSSSLDDAARKAGALTSHPRRSMETEKAKATKARGKRSTEGVTKEVIHHKPAQ
ncbi:hypothetical protein XA68_12183 [Ophiocordyceps unilateralis]|uniref:Uncharacterized protein n=1 Tax=Ophiocordyceps unilateralis TaxID=268505 RepID=A0A2A9PEW6_OPHUN|nr:hypothetical protein XA68_12183 [Ophiocordyceps unilateralis]